MAVDENRFYKERHVIIINTINGGSDLGITTEIPKVYVFNGVPDVKFYRYADVNRSIHMINMSAIVSIDNYLWSFYDSMRKVPNIKPEEEEMDDDGGEIRIKGFDDDRDGEER